MGVIGGIGPRIVVSQRAIGGEVPAVGVVDIAIGIIIDAIPRDLAGIDKQIGREVGMGEFHPVIHDRNHGVGGTGGHIPGRRGVDIGIHSAAGDPGVFQVPLQIEQRIVGGGEFAEVAEGVRLNPGQSRIGLECLGQQQRLVSPTIGDRGHELIGGSRQGPIAAEPGVVAEEVACLLARLKRDDHLVGGDHPLRGAGGFQNWTGPRHLRKTGGELTGRSPRLPDLAERPTGDGAHARRAEGGESQHRRRRIQPPFQLQSRQRAGGGDQIQHVPLPCGNHQLIGHGE